MTTETHNDLAPTPDAPWGWAISRKGTRYKRQRPPTQGQKDAAIAARMTGAKAASLGMMFGSRGLSDRTVAALADHGLDAPEHLLFMSEHEIENIAGIGKTSVAEIEAYRNRFIRQPQSTPAERRERDQEIKLLRRKQEMYRAIKDAENKVRMQWSSVVARTDAVRETYDEFNKRVSTKGAALVLARKVAREEVRARWAAEDAEAAMQRVELPAHISRIDPVDPTDPDIIDGARGDAT